MKIVAGEKNGIATTLLNGERHEAMVVAVLHKHVSSWIKEKLTCPFLRCRITAGRDEGREVDFAVPSEAPTEQSFHAFLASALHSAEVGEDIEPERLIGAPCAIREGYTPECGGVSLHLEPLPQLKEIRVEGGEWVVEAPRGRT